VEDVHGILKLGSQARVVTRMTPLEEEAVGEPPLEEERTGDCPL